MRKARLQKKVDSAIGDAAELHGHLGPFLVIGVRMGKIAERLLKKGDEADFRFHVDVRVPLAVPFSCTIDGIQSTTHCTIGNRRLTTESSGQDVYADFRLQDSGETLNVSVNPEVVKDLMRRMAKGETNEELADRVASMRQSRLFKVTKQ